MKPEVRSVWLDIARKPQSVEWIERLILRMGALGLNRLGLHLSDSIGCALALPRLEGRHRELDLTKADVARLVGVARGAGVELVPEVDMPSHMVWLLQDRPDLQLPDRDGNLSADRLDVSMPEALDFARELWAEVDEWFGPGTVHLGGDEYLTAPWEEHRWDLQLGPDTKFSQLLEWAAKAPATNDPEAGVTYEDAMALWFNTLAEPFLAAGREVVIWNDHVRPSHGPSSADGSPGGGYHRVDQRIVLDCWIRWRDYLPSATDFVDDGHRVINANGDQLYFILGKGGGPATTGPKSPEGLRAWRPRQFMGAAGGGGDHWLPEDRALYGTQLSVWCDEPTAMEPEPMWQALDEWLVAYAETLNRD